MFKIIQKRNIFIFSKRAEEGSGIISMCHVCSFIFN